MSKAKLLMTLLLLSACQPGPVNNPTPTPVPTALPTISPTPLPTTSPQPQPSASASAMPSPKPSPMPTAGTSPVPEISSSPEPSAFPSPPALAPRPDYYQLLDPKDNTVIADYRDGSANVDNLNGLFLNEQQNGLIYWVEGSQLKARPIMALSFGQAYNLGQDLPATQLQMRFGLDNQGNGLVAWNRSNDQGIGTFSMTSTLSFAHIVNFQFKAAHEQFSTGYLYDLAFTNPESGSLLISRPRMRTAQDPAVPEGQTPIEKLAFVNGLPNLSQSTNVVNLPTFFAGADPVIAAHLDTQQKGLIIYRDHAHSQIVWQGIENGQAQGEPVVLNDLLNVSQRDVKLRLINGNGYLRWTEGWLMPIVNYRPQPERKMFLGYSEEMFSNSTRGDMSLDGNGTGLLAWVSRSKSNGQSQVFVMKFQNFVGVGKPYTMTFEDPETLVQNIKIAVNSQGNGYLSGLSLLCTAGNPCEQRLGRQIWVRRIENYIP